jgi:chaperonin GroES
MEKEMKIRPLLDKVVLKEVEAVETTAVGILLPGSAKEKPQISEVVAVGPGGMVNGEKVEMTLKEGDRVITGKYTGTQVKLDGVEYNIVSVSDVLAIVE